MKANTGWVQLTDTEGYLASEECNYHIAKQFFDADLRVYIDSIVGGFGWAGERLDEYILIINKDEWIYFSELN